MKKIRLWAGKQIMDKKGKPKPFNVQDIKKILFPRYDGKIGDYLVSSFVFQEIKKRRPHIKIHVITAPSNHDLISTDKNIDKVFLLKKRSYFQIVQMALHIRHNSYDVLFDANPLLRNRDLLFIRLVSAIANIGYDKELFKTFRYSVPKQPIPTFQIYQKMLSLLGFDVPQVNYSLPENPKALNDVTTFLERNLNPSSIALNLQGASRSRKFNTLKSIEFIGLALKAFPNHKIVLLTHPAIHSWIKEIIESIQNNRVIAFLETDNIAHNIYLIRHSQALISPDTSTVHIADAFNKPLLAFYSMEEDNFIRWKTKQEDAVILRYPENINDVSSNDFNNALFSLMKLL